MDSDSSFNPSPAITRAIFTDLAGGGLTLVGLAHRYNTDICSLADWLNSPAVIDRLLAIETAAARLVRLSALVHAPRSQAVIGTLLTTIDTPAISDGRNLRAREHARRLVNLHLRQCRFTPLQAATSRSADGALNVRSALQPNTQPTSVQPPPTFPSAPSAKPAKSADASPSADPACDLIRTVRALTANLAAASTQAAAAATPQPTPIHPPPNFPSTPSTKSAKSAHPPPSASPPPAPTADLPPRPLSRPTALMSAAGSTSTLASIIPHPAPHRASANHPRQNAPQPRTPREPPKPQSARAHTTAPP